MLTQSAVLVEMPLPSAIITLNRPERRNALSLGLMRELTSALEAIDRESEARVVILRANGTVFSSGHDLSELRDGTEEGYREIFDTCVTLMETVQRIRQPVIAEVAGVAMAAGCQLVATCDLAIASDTARFATPGVKIGLFCSTPMVAVSRAIGRKRAMEMLLTGDFIDAATAAEWGLVNRVVSADQLEATTRTLADKIAATSQHTVAIGKEAFYRQIEAPQHAAYEYTRDVIVRNTQHEDAQEGIAAFLEKRNPVWRGR